MRATLPWSIGVVVAFACSHAKPVETPPAATVVQPAPPPVQVAQPAPPEEKPAPTPEPVAEPAPPAPAPQVAAPVEAPVASVYFAFDKSDLKAASRSALESLFNQASQPGARVRIEGNCDERGSVEYNIGLGQRRADAAKRYLIKLGVPEANVVTVSFGKEHPKALGHDPASWRENRRDDLFVQPAAVSAR